MRSRRRSPRLPRKGSSRSFLARPGIDQLRGRPLVIAATEDDAEDTRVSAIARALGVPVNVPDRPELCTFALPAIVDRGEVTVAIGTSGASPVLAQRLRAWLEQELHPRLDALAKLAAEFRSPVAERLPSGPPRRKFWEAVFEGAAAEAMLEGDEDKARKLIGAAIDAAAAAPQARGRVLLVGAGPGDPELLTMKAVRALKAADVIFYDRLVGEGVLDHARREAELIQVGKAKGAHSVLARRDQRAADRARPGRPDRGQAERRRSLHLRPWRRGARRVARSRHCHRDRPRRHRRHRCGRLLANPAHPSRRVAHRHLPVGP